MERVIAKRRGEVAVELIERARELLWETPDGYFPYQSRTELDDAFAVLVMVVGQVGAEFARKPAWIVQARPRTPVPPNGKVTATAEGDAPKWRVSR